MALYLVGKAIQEDKLRRAEGRAGGARWAVRRRPRRAGGRPQAGRGLALPRAAARLVERVLSVLPS